MKIKQKKSGFKPIAITLETEEEARALCDFIRGTSHERRAEMLEEGGNQDPEKGATLIAGIYEEVFALIVRDL